ncbi:putative acyl carrier protein [Dictyocaulus viviparus]|uniref:Acyl carrier protein n=1 Tax=Dictyocaulus viviparus TaxID=29172 RepID=A0A0D8XT77_DICVI|nr:putative acyl carrier protein [Dictyocaulus viviparus]
MLAQRIYRTVHRLSNFRRGIAILTHFPTTSTSRALTPSDRILRQKRFHQIEVFGPFDPPKQLTFKEVETRVLKAIRAWDRFPADKEALLQIDSDFTKDLGFDSLDQVEIMMSIEDEFGFEIPLEDSEKMKNGRDVFKYICDREDVFE